MFTGNAVTAAQLERAFEILYDIIMCVCKSREGVRSTNKPSDAMIDRNAPCHVI